MPVVGHVGDDRVTGPVLARHCRVRRARTQCHDAGGSGGCNTYAAPVNIDGDAMAFGRLASTRMACAPPLLAPSQGVHFMLDRSFLPGDCAIMVPQTEDGRVLFAIPWLDREPAHSPLRRPFVSVVAFLVIVTVVLNMSLAILRIANFPGGAP